VSGVPLAGLYSLCSPSPPAATSAARREVSAFGGNPSRKKGRRLYCRARIGFCASRRAHGKMMRITQNIVGSLLVLVGAIWFLQGINVLPGSFMTGQIRWAVYGGIAVAAGIALLLRANRTPKD
jgi:hypothetical protein